MFSFEMNKIAGAVLGALLLAMSLDVVSDLIFSHATPAQAGYDLPAAKQAASAERAKAGPAASPLPERLAKADVQKGEADTRACQACHNFEKGAPAKIGPPLYGVVDRAKGSIAGFSYSDAIKSKGGVWTLDDLDQFIANPKAYASGTKMTYAGEPDGAKRADIIAYLNSLSDHPAPAKAGYASPPPANEAASAASGAAAPAPAAAPAALPLPERLTEADVQKGEASAKSAASEAAAPAALPLPQRLAKADVQKGEADAKACHACHNFKKGAPAKIGPPLYGVVNRPKGSIAGFSYSNAIKAKGGVWTLDDLDQFIANPKAYASGTKMTYAGELDSAKRADIIAYLDSLSAHPAPLATK